MQDQLKPEALEAMLGVAKVAVRRASEVCRIVQGSLDRVRAVTKDDDSPVTVADFAAQAVVARTLRQRLGSFRLIAEESSEYLRRPEHAAQLSAAVEAARHVWPEASAGALLEAIDDGTGTGEAGVSNGFWTLDPIDGTKGFLRGQQYAVCLAYIVGDSPVVAVLGCPNLPADFEAALDVKDAAGCLYASQRGAGGAGDRAGVAVGACVLTDREVPMRVEPRRGSSDRVPILVESFEPSHSRRDSSEAIMREVVERRFGRGAPVPAVRIDSQCKYAVVARGQADVYLRLPSKRGYVEKIWDHAAGALIAEQAGCVVSDARGKPLDFSCGPDLARNRGVVVAPPGLHADVIGAIAGLGMSEESATR